MHLLDMGHSVAYLIYVLQVEDVVFGCLGQVGAQAQGPRASIAIGSHTRHFRFRLRFVYCVPWYHLNSFGTLGSVI